MSKWIRAFSFWVLTGYRHFSKTACFARAGSLAFSSILTLVPLMVVGIGILSLMPMTANWQIDVQDFIFNNFVASSGKVVQHYLHEFAENVSQLSGLSIIFLAVTAIDILFSIELSLNAIWCTRKSRRWYKALALYFLILVFAPILFSSSILLTFIFIHTSFAEIFSSILPMVVMKSLPIILSFAIFFFIYKIMPHCHVKSRYACYGAVISAILFELAKIIFAWYVKAIPTYRIVYGAVAALPIFLIWIYICWMIVLIGAVASFLLQNRKSLS